MENIRKIGVLDYIILSLYVVVFTALSTSFLSTINKVSWAWWSACSLTMLSLVSMSLVLIKPCQWSWSKRFSAAWLATFVGAILLLIVSIVLLSRQQVNLNT